MKQLLPLLLVAILPWQALCSYSSCTDHPFDIRTNLVPKDGVELDCSRRETMFIARQIAKTVNYVVVDTLKRVGVIQSKTRICKDGELLHEDSHSALLLRARRSLRRRRRFVFRGSGFCRKCWGDNYDYRKLFEGPDSPVEAVLWNETTNFTTDLFSIVGAMDFGEGDGSSNSNSSVVYDDDHRRLGKKTPEERKRIRQESRKKSAQLNMKNLNDFRIIQGYKKPKHKGELKLDWDPSRAKYKTNGFGMKNVYQKQKASVEVGVFKKDDMEVYYYNYLRDDLSFKVLAKILRFVLQYILIQSKENEHLCTYRNLRAVRVKIESTLTFRNPVCPADTN